MLYYGGKAKVCGGNLGGRGKQENKQSRVHNQKSVRSENKI